MRKYACLKKILHLHFNLVLSLIFTTKKVTCPRNKLDVHHFTRWTRKV